MGIRRTASGRWWRQCMTVLCRQRLRKNGCFYWNTGLVWDVIQSCEIVGSSDSSIKDAVANDLRVILNAADIRQIFVNGRKAEELYKKYIAPRIGRDAVCLPSTSPANAAWSVERLVSEWKKIVEIV